MTQGLVPVVIEVEVLHGQHADRSHQLGIERSPLLVGRLELLEPIQQLGQPIAAIASTRWIHPQWLRPK